MATRKLSIISDQSNNNLTFLIDAYLQYKERSLAENSIRAYRQNMRYFRKRCGSIKSINRTLLNKIINEEGQLKTKNLRKAVIDNFIEWCVKEKHLPEPIETEVYKTRAEKHKNNILTINETQLRVLLAGVNNGKIRDVLNVGFYMGLRINELVHCRPEWVINDGKFLRVGDLYMWNLDDEFHPKSQKEHDVPMAIPPQVQKIFERGVRRTEEFGRMFGFNSDSTLRQNLKDCFAALPKPLCDNFTAHHLRHSCISYWLNEKRVPVQEVQRLARHARMETTMKYYHPDNDAHLSAFSG